MQLGSVVPWGRSFEEYCSIFSLTESDLRRGVLGCGDGPANFNATLTRKGAEVVSVDPVYQFSGEQIRDRITEVYPHIMSQMEANAENYLWDSIENTEALGQVRMAAMEDFLADYEAGCKADRYIAASLPTLPFSDQEFGLGLCSHFLFLYSDHVGLDQHIAAMKELCRVASEARVYPLLSLDGKESRHLPDVIKALGDEGIQTSLQPVKYRFQLGATDMLVARRVM